MKIADLEGMELDYWVMRADGGRPIPRPAHWTCSGTKALQTGEGEEADVWCVSCQLPSYSEHWDTNGLRLIEKYRIHLMPHRGPPSDEDALSDWWYAEAVDYPLLNAEGKFVSFPEAHGPSALIAGLRCIVAIRFGEEVPNE